MSKFFDETMQGLLEAAAIEYNKKSDESSNKILKRCPFCGEEAKLIEDTNHISYVKCSNGCCSTPYLQDPKTARRVWNRRDPVDDVMTALNELQKEYRHETNSGFIDICIDIVKEVL